MNKEAACAVDCSDWRLSLFLILSSSLPFCLPLRFLLQRRIKTPSCNRKVEMKRGAISSIKIELCDLSEAFKDNWSKVEMEVRT